MVGWTSSIRSINGVGLHCITPAVQEGLKAFRYFSTLEQLSISLTQATYLLSMLVPNSLKTIMFQQIPTEINLSTLLLLFLMMTIAEELTCALEDVLLDMYVLSTTQLESAILSDAL